MTVNYFLNIFKGLLEHGLKEAELARYLKTSRQHIQNLLGKTQDRKPQQNLKDEQLSLLIKLCKKHNLEPKTWNELGKLIDKELKE